MLKKSLFIFVFLSLITSCKSTKKYRSNMETLSAKSIIKKNAKAQFDKKNVKATLVVKYKGKVNLPNLKASLRIVKDSVIWLSLSKFGFPVAKLMITPKRVQFYEKISKTYFDGDFELISEALGTDFDFKKAQNLFFGEPLLPLKKGKYIVNYSENTYLLNQKKPNDLFDISFWIDPNTFKLVKEHVSHAHKNQTLTIAYPNFTEIEGNLFPSHFKIKATSKQLKTNINVTYKNVVFDTALSFPFKIPSSYKKIKLK